MANIMNKVLNTKYLGILHKTLKYIQYHNPPILLDQNTPFAKADEPLFDNDFYVDTFIRVYLDRIIDNVHEAIIYFNIVINTFNLFFSSIVDNLLNSLK